MQGERGEGFFTLVLTLPEYSSIYCTRVTNNTSNRCTRVLC